MQAILIPTALCILGPLALALLSSLNQTTSKTTLRVLLLVSSLSALSVLILHIGNFVADETFLDIFGYRLLVIDRVFCLMMALISFINLITLNYANNYLDGNRQKQPFIGTIALLATVVSLLTAANNVAVMTLCWCLVTPLLVSLLAQNKTDAAVIATRRMLGHHILADSFFVAAMLLLTSQTGSQDLFAISQKLMADANSVADFAAVSALLALAALIKSAVFPLHSWLLGSLEAPTPLSAFLHAGVVNIAGFISLRFAPMLSTPYLGGNLLIAFGLTSAIVGALCSIVQPDVKRKLVYSTVAQMGFMCLQCGIGALHAALFHLIFHGCFKCYLFLSAGGAIAAAKTHEPHRTSAMGPTRGCISALLIMAAGWLLFNNTPTMLLPTIILTVALVFEYLCLEQKHETNAPTVSSVLFRTLMPWAALIVVYACGCEFFASYVVHGLESSIAGAVLLAFGCFMLLAWTAIRSGRSNAIKDWLYVFAANGGYLTRQ